MNREIEHCFGAATVEEIIQRTQKYESEEWAQNALKGLKKASPSSLKVLVTFCCVSDCMKGSSLGCIEIPPTWEISHTG
jgi:hypothetical protein